MFFHGIFSCVEYVKYTYALVDRKNKVLLDWSAKSGSAVGVMMFLRHMGLLEEANKDTRWIHNYRIDVFYRKFGLATYRDLIDPSFVKLKIVRNPFDRVVSSYIHTMLYPTAEIKAITGNQRPDMTFREFLRAISTLDLSICNSHYQTQFRPYEAEGVVFDHILHLERFAEDVAKANERSGLSLNPNGLSSHHHVKKDEALSSSALDMKWSALSGQIPRYSNFYDSGDGEAVRLVSRLYEKDFVSYGYPMEITGQGIIAPSCPVTNSRGPLARRLSLMKYSVYDILRNVANSLHKRF